jgi:Cu-Zn family superoxide dismutase
MNNFFVKANGTATVTITERSVNLGTDAYSLFTNGGTSLVIHAKADDMKTDPSGNSGDRIVCGVIAR